MINVLTIIINFVIALLLTLIVLFIRKCVTRKSDLISQSDLLMDLFKLLNKDYSINNFNVLKNYCNNKTKTEIRHAIILLETDFKAELVINIGFAILAVVISMIKDVLPFDPMTSSEIAIFFISGLFFVLVKSTLEPLKKEAYILNVLKSINL